MCICGFYLNAAGGYSQTDLSPMEVSIEIIKLQIAGIAAVGRDSNEAWAMGEEASSEISYGRGEDLGVPASADQT